MQNNISAYPETGVMTTFLTHSEGMELVGIDSLEMLRVIVTHIK